MARTSRVYSDTGIYRRVRHHADGEDIPAAMEGFFEGLRRFHNLDGHLERIEADAAAILKPHQPTSAELKKLKLQWQKLPPHVLRTGWEKGLTDDERERVRDALDALFTLVSLRSALKARDCKAVALWGMKLGTIIERVDVRIFEPLTRTGKKIKHSAKLGHQAVYGTDAERQAEYEKYRQEFNAIYPAKYEKKTTAYRKVAAANGVSEKTVRRAVTGK